MGAGTKNMWIGALGMLCVILVVLLVLSYRSPTGLSVGGVQVQATPTSTGTCPDSGKVTLRVTSVDSVLSTTGSEVGNANTVGVYLSGATQPLDTITTTANVYTASSSGKEIPCGSPFYLISPATTSTTYYNTRFPSTGTWSYSAFSVDYKLVTDKIGSFSLTAQNGTSGDWQATGMRLAIGGNTDNSDMVLKIKENSGEVLHGPFLIGIAYNPSNFTTIEVVGGTSGCGAHSCPSWGTVASSSNSSTLFSYQKFFIVPGSENGLKSYASLQAGIRAVTSSLCKLYTTGASADCEFVIRVSDLGARVKDGQIIQEYANSDSGSAEMSATDAVFKVVAGN
jgi:hypothetical protein